MKRIISLEKLSPVVFVDRDGTLIEEGEYLREPRKVKFLPGVLVALRKLIEERFAVIVVSNQSGVGRGIITLDEMRRVDERFKLLLKRGRVRLSASYDCPHAPTKRCPCRKPKLGMLKQAGRELGIDWRKSISIGDRPSDVLLGQRTGGIGILVRSGYGESFAHRNDLINPDALEKDFPSAVKWILNNVKRTEHDKSSASPG